MSAFPPHGKPGSRRASLLAPAALASLLVSAACTPEPSVLAACPAANVKLTALKDAQYVSSAVDPAIETLRSQNDVPGCAVAVVDDDEIASLSFSGVAEIDGGRDWDEETPAPVGSIAKTLTALAVLQLLEDKATDVNFDVSFLPPNWAQVILSQLLGQPIVNDLPFLPPDWAEVTPSQLLSHTSGIPKDPDQELEPLTDGDLQDWFPNGGDHPGIHPRYAYFTYWKSTPSISFAGDDTARYSNLAYALAGTVVDYLSYGEPFNPPPADESGYERFVFERVGLDDGALTEPTMISLCLTTPWRQSEIYKLAQGYQTDGTTPRSTPAYSGWEGPAGGWTMTIGDLARLMIIINTHRRLEQYTTDELMLDNYGSSGINTANNGKKKWGLGVYRDIMRNRFAFGKGGNYPGFTSHFIMWRNEGVGVGLICNRHDVPEEAMTETIVAIADPRLAGPFGSGGESPAPPRPAPAPRRDAVARLSREHPEEIAQLTWALADLPGDRGPSPAGFLAAPGGEELARLFEKGDLDALATRMLERIEEARARPKAPVWTDCFE